MSDSPNIILNGLTFTLLNRFEFNSYNLVLYSVDNGKEVQKYAAYKSRSEGLWRFAYLIPHFGRPPSFKKGDDYITTTQMHMDLQCLFETHYKTLPLIDMAEVHQYATQKKITEDPKRESKILAAIEPLETYYERNYAIRNNGKLLLPDESRRTSRDYVNPVFLPLVALIRPGEGITRLVYAMTNPAEEIIENSLGFYKRKRDGEIHESEIANFKTSRKNIRKMPRDFYFQKMQELLLEISEREGLLISQTNDSPLVNITFNLESTIQTAIVSLFSEYMKFFFKTGTKPSERVCEIEMPIPGSTTTIKLVIYKRQLQLIKDGSSFDLYYAVYTIPNTFPEIKGTYKTIVNLVPSPSLANEFGMNKYYISTGIYVYKIFDYEEQFPREGKPLFAKYVFLGDLLTKMWPLQDVREAATGGHLNKRRRHHRTKRAHSKRRHTRR